MTIDDGIVNFVRNFLGDVFCLDCYKKELGLTDRKEAEEARAAQEVARYKC